MHLLAGVHAGGEGHAGDLLLDRSLDRGHGHVADAAVVEALLEVVPLSEVRRHLTVQIDLNIAQWVRSPRLNRLSGKRSTRREHSEAHLLSERDRVSSRPRTLDSCFATVVSDPYDDECLQDERQGPGLASSASAGTIISVTYFSLKLINYSLTWPN